MVNKLFFFEQESIISFPIFLKANKFSQRKGILIFLKSLRRMQILHWQSSKNHLSSLNRTF